MTTLKPCPWCPVPPALVAYGRGRFYVGCQNSKCRVVPGTFSYTKKSYAIAAWNNRKGDEK